MNSNTTYLEGIVSIESAIKSKKREIYKVYCDAEKKQKRDRKALRFISFLKENGIVYEMCDRQFIDSLAQGSTHGGFIADVSDRSYTDLSSLVKSLDSCQYLVFLDGVEDPFNFGYSIRNLYAFGCKGFIIPQRNWMSQSAVVAKASAGTSESCEIAIAPDDDRVLEILKETGTDIVCSALSSVSIPLYRFKPQKPFVLFIGGEKRGISQCFMENASSVVHIPYSNENAKYSLPTASCAAIFGSYLASINA